MRRHSQRLAQVSGGFAGVAVAELAVAGAFEDTCFRQWCSDVAGDGQRPAVVLAGLPGGWGSRHQIAKVVQCRGLAVPVAKLYVYLESLLVAGRGGRVVPGQLLYAAESGEDFSQAKPVAGRLHPARRAPTAADEYGRLWSCECAGWGHQILLCDTRQVEGRKGALERSICRRRVHVWRGGGQQVEAEFTSRGAGRSSRAQDQPSASLAPGCVGG
jgi:hypothetical protein